MIFYHFDNSVKFLEGLIVTTMNYKIGNGLIIITLAGNYSIDEMLDLTRTALDDPDARIPARILADASESQAIRNSSEIERVASTVSAWKGEIEKIAVFVKSEVHYGAMQVGIAFSTFSSFDVSPFRSYEAALAFLKEE